MPKVTRPVSGRTGTRTLVGLTWGLLCTQEEELEGPAAHCCQGIGLPALPQGVSFLCPSGQAAL